MKRKQEVLHERQKSRELLCMRIYKPGSEKKARKTFFLLCVCVCACVYQKPESEADDLAVQLKMLWKCVCWCLLTGWKCYRLSQMWEAWEVIRMKQLAHPPFYDTEERKEGRKEREWRGRRVRGRGGKEGGRENQKQTVGEGKEGK